MKTFVCFAMTIGMAGAVCAAETTTAQAEPGKAVVQKTVEPSKDAPPVHTAPETPETTLTNKKNDQMKPETEKALQSLEKDADAGKKKRKKK